MSEETKIELEDILRHFRELNATQAQEIAILKATVDALSKVQNGSNE